MVPNNSLEQSRPSGLWLRSGWMTALLPSSHLQGLGAAVTPVRWKQGGERANFQMFSLVQMGAGLYVCARLFTLHANSDVPVAAQTSCCCWRSSQNLFSSVVKFNFNILLCHGMCSLPSCWRRPSCAALAGCRHPRVKAELQISRVSSDRFYEESASLSPSIPLSLSFPSPWTMHFLCRRRCFPLIYLWTWRSTVKFLKTVEYPTKGPDQAAAPAGSVRQEPGSGLVPVLGRACGQYRQLDP